MSQLTDRIEDVRDALNEARKGLSPEDDRSLLEQISAYIRGHLDELKEESEVADELAPRDLDLSEAERGKHHEQMQDGVTVNGKATTLDALADEAAAEDQ